MIAAKLNKDFVDEAFARARLGKPVAEPTLLAKWPSLVVVWDPWAEAIGIELRGQPTRWVGVETIADYAEMLAGK